MRTLAILGLIVSASLALGNFLDKTKKLNRIRRRLIWAFLAFERVEEQIVLSSHQWIRRAASTILWICAVLVLAIGGVYIDTRSSNLLNEHFGSLLIGQAVIVSIFVAYIAVCVAVVVNAWRSLMHPCFLVTCVVLSFALSMLSRIAAVFLGKDTTTTTAPFSYFAGLLSVLAVGFALARELLG